MHRAIPLFAFLVVFGAGVQAQTPVPTATPHPDALLPGVYQFEDLSSPQIELTGVNWRISSIATTSFLVNSSTGSTLTFHVTDTAGYLLIHLDAKPAGFGTWEICVGSTCTNVSEYNFSRSVIPIPIDLYETNDEVVITKTNNSNSSYDFFQIVQGEVIASEAGAPAESTPEPYAVYGSVEGESGTVETRFDYLVTAGDVAIATSLSVLMLSLVAIAIMIGVNHVR